MKQDYKEFDVLDFAQDAFFIQWIRAETPETKSFWDNWLSKNPEKQNQIDEASALVKRLQFQVKSPTPEVEQRIWDKINEDISDPVTVPSAIRRRLIWAIPAAAAVALLLLLFLPNGKQVIKTQYAEHTVHELPDRSTVYLNADSKISYNPEKWDSERELILEGEAFFEVIPGSVFTVSNGKDKVEVLGTSFNVYNREKFFVECYTGKVRVSSGDLTPVVLSAGKAISFEGTDAKPSEFKTDNKNWRSGSAAFKAEKMSSVFSELERQYDIEIQYSSEDGKRNFSGSFEFDDLNDALEEVCKPMNLSFTKSSNRTYRITSK